MGATASKPQTPAESEKAQYASSAPAPETAALHHAADRLARIQAESTVRQASSAPSTADITPKNIKDWKEDAFAEPAARLAALTLHNASIPDSLHTRKTEIAHNQIYNLQVPVLPKSVTNQKSSGRCWLFATTNLIRLEVIRQLDIKDADFELSQSYLHFWDKLEKANYWLENAIELADRPWDDRELNYLSRNFSSDGGQFNMATNLAIKYGICPQSVYPESFNSSNTSKITWLTTVKLREYAQELRDLKKVTEERLAASVAAGHMTTTQHDEAVLAAVRSHKEKQMKEVYRMMAIAYGAPPGPHDEFKFEWYDSKGRYQSLTTTPYEFQIKYTGTFTAKGCVSLVHDPRYPEDTVITVDRLGNVWNGQPVTYINTSVEEMERLVVKSIRAGHTVFFGCDVGQFSHTPSGIMDTDLFDYESAFGVKLGLSKKERLEMGESQMTHAMLIDKVHVDPATDTPIRYAVQNSWGAPGVGKDTGYMSMSRKWFAEFTYQCVFRTELLSSKHKKLVERGIDEHAIHLPPYDPMGALA